MGGQTLLGKGASGQRLLSKRFIDPHWKNILDIVLAKLGPAVQSDESFDCYLGHHRPWEALQHGSPEIDTGRSISPIAGSIRELVTKAPAVVANPALSTPQAKHALAVAIDAWVHEQSSRFTCSNNALGITETAMVASQGSVENRADGGDSEAKSETEWCSPPPEDLMMEILHKEESSGTTAEANQAEVPCHSQEAPTSAQPREA